ncbi:uncharacterized protein [Argopecten irradians]|uniref:uncharacterized protein n=1 Tax=Argopecten irradians TaxID=31199 RepID=UPI0037156B6E
MDSSCGKLLTATVILPFSAGNYRRRPNGSHYYDCFISSRVLILIFCALVIGFTISRGLPKHAEIRLALTIGLLLVLLISSIAIFFFLGCQVKRHGLESVVAAERKTNSWKLQVVFLWIFGLSSGLYCTLFVGKQIECLNTGGGLYWNLLLIFNIFLIIGVFVDIIFMSYFSPYKLRHRTSINNALTFLFAANVTVILYIYLIGSTVQYLKETTKDTSFKSCLEDNSTVTKISNTLHHYLTPTFVEFTLMSCTILLDIWPTKQNSQSDSRSTTDINQNDETQPLLVNMTTPDHQYANNRTLCQMVTYAFSIAIGLGLIVCYAVLAFDEGDLTEVQKATYIYELTLKGLMILAIFVGFFCLLHYCTPDDSSKGLKPADYVYLFSAFGVFMSHICISIGADEISADITFANNVLSFFHDYIQVVFLLYSNRCRKTNNRSHIHLLESVLIFIMISNFVLWFINSFFLSEYPNTRQLPKNDFTKELLGAMVDIFLPVSVFYRFTSFLEYYTTYEKFNP